LAEEGDGKEECPERGEEERGQHEVGVLQIWKNKTHKLVKSSN
jgi:hypothetical protein